MIRQFKKKKKIDYKIIVLTTQKLIMTFNFLNRFNDFKII